MTTLVSVVTTRAATILQDLGAVRWTTAELVDWASEGEGILITIKPDAYTTTSNQTLVAGAKQSVPTGCVAIVDVRQNVGGAAVTPCARQVLDQFSPNWMTTPTSSTVKHWMPDDNPAYYYVYPAQSATPGSVVVTCCVKPPALTAMGNMNVRDIYAPNITNYVIYRALSKDAEFGGAAERAIAHYKLFAEG